MVTEVVAAWRELRAPAVRAQHVRPGHEEAASDQRRVTLVALEAVVVPVTLVERDELRRAQTFVTQLNTHIHTVHYQTGM